LSGFVHNLHDGRVEAVFQGQKASVDRLIEWCRIGPPEADVADVSVRWERPSEELAAF
jgi:acylphosphatase